MEYYTIPVTVYVMYIMINNVQFCLVALVNVQFCLVSFSILKVSKLRELDVHG